MDRARRLLGPIEKVLRQEADESATLTEAVEAFEVALGQAPGAEA